MAGRSRIVSIFWLAPVLLVSSILASSGLSAAAASSAAGRADTRLDRALDALVKQPDGPPGIAVFVQRGTEVTLHRAGTAVAGAVTPIEATAHLRLASVAKAFSGAVALSLVASSVLSLDDTVGERLPTLPAAWSAVTLRQLLQHTSGIPDFSKSKAFQQALAASLQSPPPHAELLSYAVGDPLEFPPGSKYEYSNSDNIVVALMVEAATGHSYSDELRDRVLTPLGLLATSLPDDSALPEPFVHGYDIKAGKQPDDVSSIFAAGWTWSSGGVVSTPSDANWFVRGYARGATTNEATRAAQRKVVPGSSEPPGPGRNSAGLAIYRYQTSCGTVYGHTGNTAGFTQFIAGNSDGTRSLSVSTNAQIIPKSNATRFKDLRKIYELGVCAALAAS